MSLLLKEGTSPPVDVMISTPPDVRKAVQSHVTITLKSEVPCPQVRISFPDFLAAVAYFLINNDLTGPEDPRRAFLAWSRTLEVTGEQRSDAHPAGYQRIRSLCHWEDFFQSWHKYVSKGLSP